MTNNQLTDDRLVKILSETQATIMEHNSRCVRGSVEVDTRLFESMIMELQERRKAEKDSEPVAWSNGCNKSVPAALRYLAENPRSIGGESSFNTAHLYQLAREIECMSSVSLYRHAQPTPVVPQDVLEALQKVARIRLDMNDFDGDRRGIADCLGDAEEALIEVVNRRAAMLAAAPQDEAKKDKPHNNFGTGARLTNHRFKV